MDKHLMLGVSQSSSRLFDRRPPTNPCTPQTQKTHERRKNSRHHPQHRTYTQRNKKSCASTLNVALSLSGFQAMPIRTLASLSSPWRSSARFTLLTITMLLFCRKSFADVICPIIGQVDSSSELESRDENGPNFSEVSGLALSSTQTAPSGRPVMYANNDSGSGKRLGVFDSGSGKRLLTLRIPSLPSAFDWESLAIGSCGIHGETASCIYIGDIGDNLARVREGTESGREGNPYRIYKIREPILHKFDDNDAIEAKDTYVLEYDYRHPSSPTEFADSEAIFLDHQAWGEGENKGDIYVVTKWSGSSAQDKTRLFQIPASAWDLSEVPYSPAAVGDCPNGGDLYGNTWTMADMTLDGTLIALGGTGSKTFLFPRCPGVRVAEALTGDAKACLDWRHISGQTETFAWTPDGTQNLIMAERELCDQRGPPMSWTTMDYESPAAKVISCPEKEPSATKSEPHVCPTMAPTTPSPTQEPQFSDVFADLICQYSRCLKKYTEKFEYAPKGFAKTILSKSEQAAEVAFKKVTDSGDVIVPIKRMRSSLKKFQQYRAIAIERGRLVAQTYAECSATVGGKCSLDLLEDLIDAVANEDKLKDDVNLVKPEKLLKQARGFQRKKNYKLATSRNLAGIQLILNKLDGDFVGAPACGK